MKIKEYYTERRGITQEEYFAIMFYRNQPANGVVKRYLREIGFEFDTYDGKLDINSENRYGTAEFNTFNIREPTKEEIGLYLLLRLHNEYCEKYYHDNCNKNDGCILLHGCHICKQDIINANEYMQNKEMIEDDADI